MSNALTQSAADRQNCVGDRRFLNKFNEMAQRFENEMGDRLLAVAQLMADAVEKVRLIYVFGGGGHTCLVMQEIFGRRVV